MKKLFLILAVAFASVASFSYANSLTDSNSSAVLLANNTCPTYCCIGTTSIYNDSKCTEHYDDLNIYTSGKVYYVGNDQSKYRVDTSSLPYKVEIAGKTRYCRFSK